MSSSAPQLTQSQANLAARLAQALQAPAPAHSTLVERQNGMIQTLENDWMVSFIKARRGNKDHTIEVLREKRDAIQRRLNGTPGTSSKWINDMNKYLKAEMPSAAFLDLLMDLDKQMQGGKRRKARAHTKRRKGKGRTRRGKKRT